MARRSKIPRLSVDLTISVVGGATAIVGLGVLFYSVGADRPALAMLGGSACFVGLMSGVLAFATGRPR